MELLLSFFTALCISMVLVPLLMRYASKMQLVDDPTDNRRVHSTPIPRSGGIAIATGALFPLLFWLPLQDEYRALLAGILIILVVGLVDDYRNLSYRWKFFGQILAAVVLLVGGIGFHQLPFFGLEQAPVWISWPLTVVFIVGVTNAVNLTDGLDGLAAGISLLSLVVIAIMGYQIDEHSIALVALAVMGGVFGFLRFNTHPAQVFMGDTGSQFLGFVTVALALKVTQHEANACSVLLPLLLLGLPILDTFTVMAVRLVRGRFIFSPDRSHLHHQFMRAGFTHREAVTTLHFLQIIMMVLLYLFRYQSDFVLLLVYVAFCSAILAFIGWSYWTGWRLHPPEEISENKERRNLWVRKFSFLYRHSTSLIEWSLAIFLLAAGLIIGGVTREIKMLSFVLAAGLVAFWFYQLLYLQRFSLIKPRMVVRFAIYCTFLLVVYVILTSDLKQPVFGLLIDAYLMALVLLLVLAIRTTRKALFRLNNQDYLVVVLVMITPLLPVDGSNNFEFGRFAIRAIVLLYACEFVISKRPGLQPVLFGGSIVCLLSIGMLA